MTQAGEKTDIARLEAVYRAHVQFVARSARRLGARDDQLDDLVQDVFVVVARRLDDLDAHPAPRAWLFTIVANTIRGYRRATFRHLRRVEAASEVRSTAPNDQPEPRAGDRMLLLEILDTLDDDRRSVYVLTELEGMTAPEIAEGLGIKLATVYSRLRRAKEDLRNELRRRAEKESDHG